MRRKDLIKYLNLFLILLIGYMGFNLFRCLIGERSRKQKVTITAEGKEVPESTILEKTSEDYSIIWERNLFNFEEKTPQTIPEGENVPGFRLKGTVTGKNISLCIIVDENKKENLYTIADRVGESTIIAIMEDSITLQKDGERTVLYMRQMRESTKRELIPKTPADFDDESPPESYSSEEEEGPEEVEEDIEETEENATKLFAKLYLEPFFIEDKCEGFQVARIEEGSIFARAGIKSGDIIRKIYDSEIKSTEDIFFLYRN
ncbi:MAG TPA: hypothetical protein EYP78_02660, partial [Candidatus Omnitrophica bacterium]|nr:hypothetical protein [Candidatus Omnitrophota bacterium]